MPRRDDRVGTIVDYDDDDQWIIVSVLLSRILVQDDVHGQEEEKGGRGDRKRGIHSRRRHLRFILQTPSHQLGTCIVPWLVSHPPPTTGDLWVRLIMKTNSRSVLLLLLSVFAYLAPGEILVPIRSGRERFLLIFPVSPVSDGNESDHGDHGDHGPFLVPTRRWLRMQIDSSTGLVEGLCKSSENDWLIRAAFQLFSWYSTPPAPLPLLDGRCQNNKLELPRRVNYLRRWFFF